MYFSTQGAQSRTSGKPPGGSQCCMPIVDIELVAGSTDGLAQPLAEAAAAVLGSAPGQTWIRLRSLEPGCYAENGVGVTMADAPVFVTVTRRQLPAPAVRVQEIAALTKAIAGVVQRSPLRVHVAYAPAAAGRAAFGGTLIE